MARETPSEAPRVRHLASVCCRPLYAVAAVLFANCYCSAQSQVLPNLIPQPVPIRAVLIANETYQDGRIEPVTSAADEASAVASQLKALGVDVLAQIDNQPRHDLLRQFEATLEKFSPGDIAIVYYSGHGIQLGSFNFIVPVDFPLTFDEEQAAINSVQVTYLVSALNKRKVGVALIVLDACRAGLGDARAINGAPFLTGGFAGQSPASNQAAYIFYSTGPQELANSASRKGEFSPFAQALIEELKQPEREVTDFARYVFNDVHMQWTKHSADLRKQDPWLAYSTPAAFEFRRSVAMNLAAKDRAQKLLDVGQIDDIQGALNLDPGSPYSYLLRDRLTELQNQADASGGKVDVAISQPQFALDAIKADEQPAMSAFVSGNTPAYASAIDASEKRNATHMLARGTEVQLDGFSAGAAAVTQAGGLPHMFVNIAAISGNIGAIFNSAESRASADLQHGQLLSVKAAGYLLQSPTTSVPRGGLIHATYTSFDPTAALLAFDNALAAKTALVHGAGVEKNQIKTVLTFDPAASAPSVSVKYVGGAQ